MGKALGGQAVRKKKVPLFLPELCRLVSGVLIFQ